MSFGGFLDGGGGGGAGARFVADLPYTINSTTNNNPTGGIGGGGNISSGAIAPPRLITQSLTKSMFNSPGLSLALVLISLSFLRFSFDSSFVFLWRFLMGLKILRRTWMAGREI